MELRNYRNIENAGCLKAAFTVFIPEWGEEEMDCMYFEKNDTYWVNYCPKEYVNKEGKKRTWNMCRRPKEVTDRLNRAIKEKLMVLQTQEIKKNPSSHKFSEDELPF